MKSPKLRKELEKIFVENKDFQNMVISILSFGFKYGIPSDSDFIFDVRFLPNPDIFKNCNFSFTTICERMQECAFLLKGLRK